jgi:hypothetical protein
VAISIPYQRKDTYPYNKNQQDALSTFNVDWHIPAAVYTEWYLLMMSSKPARNRQRLITEIN